MNNETETDFGKKPDDRLNIHVNGEQKEVFMSGGLVRQLMPIVGSLTDIPMVFAEVDTQNLLIVECLKPRTKHGSPVTKNTTDYTIDDFEISLEDTDKLVKWIMEHVLHFFANSLTNAASLIKDNESAMKAIAKLTQSMTGSETSPPLTQSAGASVSAPVK